MIDPATAGALDRLDARNTDVRNAYVAGFVPLSNDTTRASRVVPSADPLDVALPDSAYILTPEPGGQVGYSRDGAFHFTDGELRASDGRAVLGFAAGNRKALVPLRVDPYDAALGRVSQERVEADGSVCYTRAGIDPRTGERRAERVTLGRIALARFPAGTQMERVDAEHVRPPAGVSPQLGIPAAGAFPALATKARDLGRVDILAGLEKMKEAYDNYEALRAAHHGRGETEKIAMDLVKVIVALGFASPQRRPDGRVVKSPVFRSRSTLPISAACLIANGVREQLSRSLAVELDVELIEPVVPDAAERRVLVDSATIFRVRGRLCDGFVIVRAADARRLVALAFGESERSECDPLSEIERATLDRIAGALVPLCNTLCGTLGPIVRESSERTACDLAGYFEVRTTTPSRIAIGFALTRDPSEEVGERLTLGDLADVELEGTVELGRGAFAVPAFSRITAGATIVLDTQLGAPGELRFGDVAFAYGTCGVRHGRSAISFDTGAGT